MNGKTRAMGAEAMKASSVTTGIDTVFYRRMGLTLVIGFTLWIAMSVGVYFIVRSKKVDDRFRIMTLFLYYPGRLTVCVWAPWLGYQAGNAQDETSSNLEKLNNFEMVNQCVDSLQKYDTGAAFDTLNDANSTMHTLYVCFWIAISFIFAEFLFWVVFAVDARMSRIARDHLGEDLKGNPDDKTVIVFEAGGSEVAPLMAAPGVTTTMMMQPSAPMYV
mmetsp:Transcript_47874/g.63323  ORF Transcript_47874/g.63323 Transcript_47874/m.63323 type:complete len:218 (+) Transcript_47874:1060-1713(+)